MVQRLLPPTPEEDEQVAPEPAAELDVSAFPKRHEILKGILEPLSISNSSKTDIWNAVLRPQYKFDHLERLLKIQEIPDPVKTDIWNVKGGRKFPEYPLPTGGARPDLTFGKPSLEEPVGPEGQIRQELPGLMPAKIVTDPVTGEVEREPLVPGPVPEAPLVAPGPDIPTIPPVYGGFGGAVRPEAVQVTPRPAWRKPPTPPGVIPPTPLETPKIEPDPGRELVTPKLETGRSPLLTIGGRKGRFNFDVPPEVGGTPSPRYAFDTTEGGRWFYQLENDYQGGRWENADHAEADFEGYKGLSSGARKTQLTRMWQGDAGIVKAIDDAAAAGKSFAELKGDLAPFNTHRQISVDELKTFGFPEMAGELMLGKMEEHYPLPIVKEMIPYLPKVDEDIVSRATYGELMDAKLQGPFVRWESHPDAQRMYEGILELPEEDRRKFIANRWWQQPEVNVAINLAVQYKVPWEELTDYLAEFDTTPPRQLGPLRTDAPMRPLPERDPSLFSRWETFVPWQFHETTKRVLKEYQEFFPEKDKTEEELMEEFEYDIGKRARQKNLWEFYSEELFTPGGLYERTPYEAKSLVEFGELTAAFYAVQEGKATDREEQLLIDYYSMVEEAQIRGSTMPYEIARVVSAMPAFMFEILTSGGVYTIAKRATQKTARNLLLRAMPRLGKLLAKRQAAKRGAKEVTAGFARRSLSYAEDIAGRTLVLFPTRGTVIGFERILHGDDKDLLPAMWHGYLDLSIEIFSELAGAPAGRRLSKVWKKLPIQNKITNLKNALVYRWMGKTGQGAGDYLNLLQRSGYHGVLMELAEEELGRVLRAATQLQPYQMINLRQLIIEATAFSFPGMGALAMQVAERNNRSEEQRLAEDIEFFGQLATQGLTVQQVYNRAPKRIKDAIDVALAQGETLEDLIDADQDVQTPVHGIRDIPKGNVILLPGIEQPHGGEEERRWNAYWKAQFAVTGEEELPMSDEDKAALHTEGTKRDAQSVNDGFRAAKEIWEAYDEDTPEQKYTMAYTNWRLGEDVAYPGRGADETVAWYGVDEDQVRVIQEDIDKIAQDLDIAPWRAPRSEEEAVADPLPPHIQDLVDSLPEDQRAEAAINPGYFSEVSTGEQFAATAYRGEGATLEEIYGPGSVERGIAVDLAGPAQYYSFHPEHAERYGDKITEVEVDLNNPLVIDNDQHWFEILAAAGAAHLSPITFVSQAEPTGRAAAAQKLQAWIREQGHDGIIVKVPEMTDESLEGLPAARLRDSWEHSQIVVFDVEAKVEPGKPPREEVPEEAPRRPETGNQGLLKAEGQKYIETLTDEVERDYATKFLNFKLGLEPDPGMILPIEVVGMIRLEIEALATRILKPPTEIPTTPEEVAPGPEVEVLPPEEGPAAGLVSDFLDGLPPGTTFTLTEADIPEISQLEGDAQVALDREKFLGTWKRGLSDIEIPGAQALAMRWINSETGIALASSEFEALGSTRMTAAIGRARIEEAREVEVEVLPPEGAKQKLPDYSTWRNTITEVENDQGEKRFVAEVHEWSLRLDVATGESEMSPSSRVRSDLLNTREEAEEFLEEFWDDIREMAGPIDITPTAAPPKELPAGGVAGPGALPPTPEEAAPTDEADFDAQMNRYPDGTKFTITADDVEAIPEEEKQIFIGEWQKISVDYPSGPAPFWKKVGGIPLPTTGQVKASPEFELALGEEGMSSVLKRNGLMGLLTGDFIFDKEVEPTPTDEATTPEEAASPHMTVALAVRDLLEAGESIDNPTLTKIANEAFGGTRGQGAYDPRDAYDAAEVGLNMVLRRWRPGLDFEDTDETVKRLRSLMALMPRQSDRTDEAVEMQQFSTPPELAFIATYLSGGWRTGTRAGPRMEALEPSAGTGSIATMMQLGGMDVTANETAPRRAQLLRDQGFETTEHDAEFLHSVLPMEIQPDIIVMNPPFSATGGRTVSHATKYGAKHVKEALARLGQGGRLIAIVGQGMAYNKPTFSEWWDRIGDQYNIRANVGISGKHYGKWGTNFGQQLLVIDKTGPTPGETVAQRMESIIMGEDLSPLEALRLLEPLALEDISGRLAERPTEEGVRGPAGAIPPGPGAGVQPPPDIDITRPEGGQERVDKPTPGVRGPPEREELGGLGGGVGPAPGPGPEGVGPGYGEGGRGGPGGPGGAPGVGGLPGGGDLGRAGPSPGIEEGPEFGAKNTVFKKEDADAALERLRKKLKSQLDVGLDPDMMKDMFKVGGYLFESGIRRFADWAKKMIELLGEGVRSVLQSVFDTVKGFYETSSQEKGAQYTKENRQSVVDEIEPFSKYTVRKATFEGSQPHPADVVESSILASVEPPDSTYEPNIPSEVITEGRLSDLQMEAVSYIGQRHETVFVDGTRGGFWLGDGTGLGKGREIVGAMWDNHNRGRRRALWISVNHVLGSDAERDVTDMGAPMKIIRQKESKYKSGKPIDDRDGILFTAYSMMSYRIRGNRQRFNQVVDWLGPDFDGIIAFDESHLLKNALKGDRSGEGVEAEGGTQSGRMAAMLEEMYPKARFIYVSATGATVPRNMGYMTRLGLWGAGRPFPEFINFLQAMQRGGLGAMEMLSRDLKAIGAYMSRIISYEGVGYETVRHDLTPMEIDSYNKAADIWQNLIEEFEAAQTNANQPRSAGGVWSAFYGGEQRFFLQYMMSLKLPDLFTEVTKDLALGRTVIINLFNTNEEMTDRMVRAAKAEGISIDELDFTPKQMIIDLINRYFPLIEYEDVIDPKSGASIKVIKYQTEVDPITGKVVTTDKPVLNRENLEKQAELLDKLADVNFPENPMDAIVNHFGVENVSEVSGRTKRLIRGEHVVRKVKGVRRDELNEYETSLLQEGTNRMAVITGSAATGISMHSDLSKKNQQQRVFYAFQLNWSADKQLQSFGRVHRSNQSSAPIYKLMRTNLKSEERIVNATSRRLAGLGALTTGSREALAGGLFEIEDLTDVYGESAMVVTYDDIFHDRIQGIEGGPALVGIMGMLDGNGNVDRQHSSNVNRFLNRIMALHVDVQNGVFNRFYEHYQRIVQMAKDEGSFDLGIQPIRDRNFNKPIGVTLKEKPNNPETVHVDKDSGAKTELIDLVATYPIQKVTYEDALKMGGTANRGFFVNVRSKKIYTVYPTNKTKYSAEAVRKGYPGTQALIALTNPKGLTHEVAEFQLDAGNFQRPEEFQRTQAAAEAMRRREARRKETLDVGDKVIFAGKETTITKTWIDNQGIHMVELSRMGPGRLKYLMGERIVWKGSTYTVMDAFEEAAVDMVALEVKDPDGNLRAEHVPVSEITRPGEEAPISVPRAEVTRAGEEIPEPPAAAILSDQQMWEAELALMPDVDQVTVTMLVGAVTPVYDKVIGSGDGALRRLRVVRTVLDDGTAYVGMHIQANEVGALKERLGIGTPLGALSAKELYDMVEAGATIELDNGWRLRITKVHAETRMELDARGKYNKAELMSYGLNMEILQAKRRFFVPLDATEGPKVIEQIIELHKAVRDITTRGGGDPGVAGDPGGAGDIALDAGDLALPGDTVAGTTGELTDFDQGEYNRIVSEAQGIPATPDERRAKEVPPVRGEVPTAEFTPAEARAAKLPGNVPTNVLAEKMGLSYRDARKYVEPIETPVVIDAFPDDLPADMWPDADDPIHALGSERDMTMEQKRPEWFEKGLAISYPDVYEAYEQILVALEKNIPIRIGRFKNKARGIFKIFTEVIRLNKANNIPTAAHEIGHAIEKAIYGWEQGRPSPFTLLSPGVRAELFQMGKELYGSRRPNAGYDREGWSEFMRYYLTGELAEEKAPRTYRWFTDTFLKDNPKIQEPLNKAKELTTKYRLQGAKLRARGGIKWGQDKSNRFLDMMKELSYHNWVEMLSPLEHMSAVAERLLGEPLQEEEDPYLTARSRRLTAGGKVNTMVHRSMIDIAGNKVGPPLNDMEALVKGKQDEFAWYLWARRSQERWRDHNKDPGMSLADADWLAEELETPEFLLAAQMFYDWNKSLMNYARQGGLLNKKAYDLILEGSHDYMPLYRVFDEVDPDFVREFVGRGRMGGGNAFPFMKGKRGGRIRDPFTVAILRARQIVLQTDQRIVIQQIMRMGADPWIVDGMGIEIEEVARPNVPIPVSIEQTLNALLKKAISEEEKKQINALLAGGVKEAIAGAETMDQLVEKLKKDFAELGILADMLTFFVPAQKPKDGIDPIVPITDKNGKMRWFQVPNELYKLLEGLDVFRLKPTMDLLVGMPTRAMRMTTTALRPIFALWRNPVKDFQTFLMHTQSDAKPHILLQEWLTTMRDIVIHGEESPYFAQFLRFGLEAGTQLGQDIKQTKRAREGLFMGKWQRRMKSPLDAYRDLMSIPEMGTRVTELKLMAEKVGWKPGEQMTFNQSIQLMNAAKLASVDFTAAGALGRKMNQAVPFFNANVQGNRQFYENMRDRPRRTIIWGMSTFTTLTLALWWINKDEEWYRDMPYWERFTYWNLGKIKFGIPYTDIGYEVELPYIYQIPRAFEWGAVFSALPEALFDSVYQADPEGMKEVFGHIFNVVQPLALPPSLEVPGEIAINRDSWTWNRIIPQSETRYPPSEQKGKYTSRISTWLARIFPEITYQLGVTEQPELPYVGSPRVWDHIIRGFFGGVGPELLETAGLGIRPFGGNLRDVLMGPNDESLPVASWLFFMTRRGGKKAGRSQTVDDFYEEWARVNKTYENGKVKAYALGNKSEDEQQRFSARYQWPETPERRRYRLQLNDAEKAMQVLNLLERRITDYKQLEITRQIKVGVAREALDHPKVPMTAWEIEVYETEIAAMDTPEKSRLVTAEYVRANTVLNDPDSIFATALALGISEEEVASLIDNTTVRITLLQVDKHHPDINAEQVEEIEEQIRRLQARRLIERFQNIPIRSRFPVPPDRLPPTP